MAKPRLWTRVARAWSALRGKTATRTYAGAQGSRLSGPWQASGTSADAETLTSLVNLRSRSRQLCRDVSYAKRAKSIVVANVIGTGIRMQAQVYTTRDQLADRVNTDIEEAWCCWSKADSCHTGGRLDFASFERTLMAEIFEAGEVFVRKRFRKFGNSEVPYALELIEAERIADDLVIPAAFNAGPNLRLGIEVDEFQRPVAYYIRKRHPNELGFILAPAPDAVERVPAEEIIHLAVVERWPQTRGIPWLHAVINTFRDIAGYVEAEITRARVQASTPWTIETPESTSSFGEVQTDGSVEMVVEPGVAKRLNPGEELKAPGTNSPNPSFEMFVRNMVRNVAAGTGPGIRYSAISADYSQTTYSSERAAQLDDRDGWRILQNWFICSFREIVHRDWMQQAVLAGALKTVTVEQWALNREKYEAVRFRPRGWAWVDPTKEVAAYKDAVRSNFMTIEDVLATTQPDGTDFEDLIEQRKREIKLADAAGIVSDSNPAQVANTGKAQVDPNADPNATPTDTPADTPQDTQDTPADQPAARRVVRIQR